MLLSDLCLICSENKGDGKALYERMCRWLWIIFNWLISSENDDEEDMFDCAREWVLMSDLCLISTNKGMYDEEDQQDCVYWCLILDCLISTNLGMCDEVDQ